MFLSISASLRQVRKRRKYLKSLHIIAFTFRHMKVSDIGLLHIEESQQKERLEAFKSGLELDELMFLTTCNRVEFVFCKDTNVDDNYLFNFFSSLYPNHSQERIQMFVKNAEVYHEVDAVSHMLAVASSIDSMIIGEREIITQVRNAYELSQKNGLTGDNIRLLIKHTIQTAKRIYTETSIATKPVSVVSLAYHTLKNQNVALDARFLIIGAGVTNTNMSKFLKKHGFKNFTVFNRTISKAENLANDLDGRALPLGELEKFTNGFDVIITCTGADKHIISPTIYKNLLQGETDKKIVIDIAIPQDLDPRIVQEHDVNHISVEYLQEISNKNLQARAKELECVEDIISESVFDFKGISKEREIEIAMRAVPEKVKEIKQNALENVFAEEIDSLDEESRETLDKVVAYMEKKYMSVPMKMAKEILLKP